MSDAEVAIELSKVYKTAEQKPEVFEAYLEKTSECLDKSIVFVETREYGNVVLPLIHKHTRSYKTYFAQEQEEFLRMFCRQEIKVLITCHRLSQGIDVPHLRSVILFSSARARLETIQRIGRCLRIDPSNPTKRALVIDFVLESPNSEDESGASASADSEREKWLRGLAETRGKHGHAN